MFLFKSHNLIKEHLRNACYFFVVFFCFVLFLFFFFRFLSVLKRTGIKHLPFIKNLVDLAHKKKAVILFFVYL